MPVQLTREGTTFVTTLWKLKTADGTQTVCVTSGTRKVVYGGSTFTPGAVAPSEVQLIENLDPSNLEIILPLDAGGVTDEDLRGGKWNQARVEIYIWNYSTSAVERAWTGILFTSETDNGQLKAEVLDLAVMFQQVIGNLYSENCRAEHGDADCGRTPGSHALTVHTVVTRSEFLVTHTQANDDYFTFGKAEWTSGLNAGRKMEIESATQEGSLLRVVLADAMLKAITAGDAVTLKEGCLNTYEACILKGNVERIRAEPKLPGLYKVIQWPD